MPAAVRLVVHGRVQGVGYRDATVARARELGLGGWVRNEDDGTVRLHAEGAPEAVAALRAFAADGPRGARVERVEELPAKVEGHEQFVVRGVPAGRFEVHEHARGFSLRLEVAGGTRAWTLPGGAPSTDPAVRRLAVEAPEPDEDGAGWEAGPYEQGGRVPWPDALDRGHAVFVLHGARLRGGFALQRTRGAQWLLVKRRER